MSSSNHDRVAGILLGPSITPSKAQPIASSTKTLSGSMPQKSIESNTADLPERLVVAFRVREPRFIRHNNQFYGYDVIRLREFAERLGVTLEFQTCPLARCLQAIRNGDVDLITGIQKKPDREQYAQYTSVISHIGRRRCVYVRKDDPNPPSDLSQIGNRSLAVIRGSHYYPEFDEAELSRVPVSDFATAVRMLVHGRVDSMIGIDEYVDFEAKQLGVKNQITEGFCHIQTTSYHWFALSRKSRFMLHISKLEEIFKAMIDDGSYYSAKERAFHELGNDYKQYYLPPGQDSSLNQ